ncbi:MAG: hypothetical protein ABSG91_02085 [Syntrophobacteraceae bacterium]
MSLRLTIRNFKSIRDTFLCTAADMEILNYYFRRRAIECYFKDGKQLPGPGDGPSETFDAEAARASIVMIRYAILVKIRRIFLFV